ncbi:putative lyase [Helianthus annuus]|nr:putative lyase [Helianthus annuus]
MSPYAASIYMCNYMALQTISQKKKSQNITPFTIMASVWAFSSPFLISNSSLSRKSIVACEKITINKSQLMDVPTMATPVRRSGNYPPSLWSYDRIQSLNSNYRGEKNTLRLQTLKEAAKTMIYKDNEKEENPLKMLNLVDDLQRLGISYHFDNEISNALENIYYNYYETSEKWTTMDLNLKSLGFRLLRQHGYHVPQEIFEDIKDDSGNFKGHLHNDIMGLLNLYEASYHSLEEERILDDARDFTTKYLKESLENITDQHLSSLISHALDIPLHWMVPRVETKWFIKAYEKRSGMNPTLLELAKLDFNMVQAIHQEDLKYTSRWWNETTWDVKLSYTRDRLVESYMWAVGTNHLPPFSPLRRIVTKVVAMVTTIDDVYDVYGTLDELEQFTQAMGYQLYRRTPEYMKICFIGLYNSTNEIAYYTLTHTGFFNLSYLKKAWENQCKVYLKEAQWYHSGHKPTLEEYLENAFVSITMPLLLTHISFLTSVSSTEEILHSMERIENIIRYLGITLRLVDDLGTGTDEMARGDNPKAVQCYMNDSGATEDEAIMYVNTLVLNTWKKLNKERSGVMNSQIEKELTDCGANLIRMAHFMYHEADGHGTCPEVVKSHILSLLVNPI